MQSLLIFLRYCEAQPSDFLFCFGGEIHRSLRIGVCGSQSINRRTGKKGDSAVDYLSSGLPVFLKTF